MKKLTILLLALLSAVCFTAFGCGGNDDGGSENTPPQQTETYSVTFYDEDGAVIETTVYGKGETPACDYQKPETEFYAYTLSGWATETGGTASATLPAVTANASYYAVVNKTLKDHFLQFAEDLLAAEDVRAFVLEKIDALYNSKKSAVPEDYAALADDIYGAVRFGVEILSQKIDTETLKQTFNICYDGFYKSYELYTRVSANPSEIIAGATEYVQAALSSAISYAKQAAIDKLEDTLTLFTEKITDETIKSGIVDFKDREIAKLNGIEDIASAKAIAKTVADDALEYLNGIADQVIASVKTSVIEKLDQTLSALIEKLPDDTLKARVSTFKTAEIAKLDGITDLDSATSVSQTIADDTAAFIGELVSDAVDFIKDKAIEELDAAFSALIEKLPDDTLKARVSTFKTTEIAKLDGIEDIDSAKTVASTIASDTTEFVKQLIKDAVAAIKDKAIAELDSALSALIDKITDESLKASVSTFKTTEIAKLNGIEDIDSAKTVASTIAGDTTEFVKELVKDAVAAIKNKAITELDQTFSALIEKLPNEDLKASVSTFKTTEIAKLDGITDLDSATSVSETIASDTTEFVKELVKDAIAVIKNKAITDLDSAFSALIEKLPNEDLKTSVSTFKTTEIDKLNGIEDIDSAKTVANTIASDTTEFVKELVKDAVAAIKNKAITELDSALSALIDKITDESLKASVSTFKDQEIAKFNDVEDIDTAKATATTVASDTVNFATELLKEVTAEVRAKMSGYLESLKADLNALPSSYLPATMTAGYAQNYVTATSVNYDFTEFTAVSDVNYGGFGEQWHMVAESVAKSDAYFKAVTVTSNALSVALAAVSDLLENGAEVNFEKTGENYTVSVNYENGKMQIYVAVTNGYTIPLLGTVAPVIELCYDEDTAERTVYIYLSENAAVRSVSTADSFEFGIRYGVSYNGFSGFKESYFSIAKTDVENAYEGHIYEFTTVQGKDMIKACADFYVDPVYVSVVGNKAKGMMAYKGYINELYKTAEGKLIGYEVMEDLTIAGFTSTYNTLWFNLTDISGINTVKVTEKSEDNKSSRSTVDVYLNGSETLFSPTYNKKVVKTSRKYDIELRTRYYYGLNEDGELTEYEKKVPMMFIQEDNKNDTNFTDYPANVLADNGLTSSVTLNGTLLDKILYDYDNLIPIFKTNCEVITGDFVKSFIDGE